MRILCVDGAYFAASFRALGHQTLVIGAHPFVDVRLDRPLSLRGLMELLAARGFAPDAVVWADTCQQPTVAGLESLPWPSLAYSIDQYMNPWHVAFSAGFDTALVAQKDYLPLFASEHPRPARWLPLFCDPSRDADPGQPRDIPMAFVGTVGAGSNPERKPFLDAVRRGCPLFVTSGDYRPVFGRARIVLNQSAAGELNFRLFQAAACGAAVLTEQTGNGLEDIFTPGLNLLTYPRGDAQAAARTALAALADPGLAELARAGRDLVLAHHTAQARAREIVAHLEAPGARDAVARRLAQGPALRRRMSTAYRILALDEGLPLPPEHRSFYLQLANCCEEA